MKWFSNIIYSNLYNKTGCKLHRGLQPVSYTQAIDKLSKAKSYQIICYHIILVQHNKYRIK